MSTPEITAQLDAIYGVTAAKPTKSEPTKAKTTKPNRADFDTAEKIEAAFKAGTINANQARAHRAWITMRSKTTHLPVAAEIKNRDTSKPTAASVQFGPAVADEKTTGTTVRGTIIDYREAWGGTLFKPVVQRLWYVQTEGTVSKKARVHLNQTCWGLSHPVESLPGIGERVQISVNGNIASKVRATSWTVIGDPVDDLIEGKSNQFVRIDTFDGLPAKQIAFNVAADDAVGTTEKPRHRAYGRSLPERHLYDSGFMARFGTGLIKRHRQRLADIGVSSYQIGRARFDMDGRLHSEFGTALPGEFYWHGTKVEWDPSMVDTDTGLFRSGTDAFRFASTFGFGGTV